MTLQEFLDFNIRYVHHAVQTVEPGGDLQPMAIFFAGGEMHFVLLRMADKDAEMAALRQIMREKGATQYALIAAAWTVVLEGRADDAATRRLAALAAKHGTDHPAVRHLRREIYAVTAGDRDGTLCASLLVERDKAGRISKLTRQEMPASSMFSGRMFDLLAEARH